MRPVLYRYVDPLAQVWLDCARRVGLRVERSDAAYASYAPATRTLVIGRDDTLDADDSLAQMIFHELCHWLIQGDDADRRPDWGLDNETDRDRWREHACLRLQATLAGRHGLRRVLAPTTDYRHEFWDHLPADPLADRTDRGVVAAIAALRRADRPPWAPALHEALAATARIAAVAAAAAAASPGEPPSLWALAEPPPPPHPTGLPPAPATVGDRRCGACAWRHDAGPGRRAPRCRQADDARIDPAWPGCERWEPALDCQACGACCREAYDAVEVSRRDAVRRLRPELVELRRGPGGDRLQLRRTGERCAALESPSAGRYACAIYDDRPRTCRDFTLGSAHCLTARRRVALTP